jgi:uncharacterized repeat protein (TIGR02543 family)
MENLIMKRTIFLLTAVMIAAMLIVFTGCSAPAGGSGGSGGTADANPKAITAFGIVSPAATGVIDESAHTIAVTVPYGSTVTALVATFTTTGSSVKIGSTVQTSGTTANDFSSAKTYTVTATDGSSQNYTVTVAAVDTTAPANVTGLTAAAGIGQATLNWTPPSDSDFASVEITATPVITAITVAKGTNTAVITGLTNGTAYTFTVKSVDTTGNKSTGATASTTPAVSFSVTYIANGNTLGSVPTDSNSYASGSTVSVLSNTGGLIKAGHIFSGWNTNSSGTGTTYKDGSTFTITANKTLYAKWTSVSYSVGDTGPAGGIIFYVNSNYSSDGWEYLEAAPSNCTNSDGGKKLWWYNGTYTITGATATGIGTGKSNTAMIIANQGADVLAYNYAAEACTNLSITNNSIIYTDWFLPSLDEVISMYSNLYCSSLGNFNADYYWSSSEMPYAHGLSSYYHSVVTINFSVGTTQYLLTKGSSYYTRACREF